MVQGRKTPTKEKAFSLLALGSASSERQVQLEVPRKAPKK